jgi:prepilin-type N-terminal cleavage/methylation domain-containing protein
MSPVKGKSQNNGFSLVEMMVVVTILGIISVIAIPRFALFQVRAKQSQARSMAKNVYVAMQAWFEKNNAQYFNSGGADGISGPPGGAPTAVEGIADLGFQMVGFEPSYFGVLISDQGSSSWSLMLGSRRAMGTNAGAMTFDYWRQNANNWVCTPYDAATNLAATAIALGQRQSATFTQCPQSLAPLAAQSAIAVGVNDPVIIPVTDSIY